MHSPIAGAALRSIALVAAVLLLVLAGCQEPTQPDVAVEGVRIVVRIVDQSRVPVASALVRYRESDSASFGGFGRVMTGADGVVEQTMTIASSGAVFDFEVTPPADPEIGDAVILVEDVRIPCRDTTIEIALQRTVDVPCGVTLPAQTLASSICLNFRRSEIICTRAIVTDCARPMTISAPPITGIPGATLLLRVNGVPQASPATLANAGDACEICMEYRPTTNGSAGAQRIDVTASAPGVAPYRLISVNFSGESKCDSCGCPPPLTMTLPANDLDTVCVGEETELEYDLGSIVNTNQACDLIYTRVRGPGEGVRVRSFNGGSSVLGAGSSMGPFRILVTPARAGAMNDTVVYRVQTRTPSGGLRDCAELTLVLRLLAVAPPCPLQLTGSLIIPGDSTRSAPLAADICATASREVCISNPSTRCPLRIDDMRITGRDASQFRITPNSFPREVAPTGTLCFTIEFSPDRAYYLSSGTPPRSTFTATLEITTACGTTTRPLVGEIPPPRVPPLRLFPVDCAVNPNTGITVNNDGSIVTDQSGTGQLITVRSIDLAAGTAQLNIMTPYRFLRTGLTDQTPLCDLRFDAATLDACRSTGPGGVQTVRPGDVFLFTFSHGGCDVCALLWVESIDPASPTRSCPQVQFRICSPLVY